MERPKRQQRKRRTYSAEFKAGAISLVLNEGKSIRQVAEDLDVSHTLVGIWVKHAQAAREGRKSGGLSSSERAELSRLRQENRELRIERAILKKATAFFAKESK